MKIFCNKVNKTMQGRKLRSVEHKKPIVERNIEGRIVAIAVKGGKKLAKLHYRVKNGCWRLRICMWSVLSSGSVVGTGYR